MITTKILGFPRQADWDDVRSEFHGAIKLEQSNIIFVQNMFKLGLVLGVYLPQLDKSMDLIVWLWGKNRRAIKVFSSS